MLARHFRRGSTGLTSVVDGLAHHGGAHADVDPHYFGDRRLPAREQLFSVMGLYPAAQETASGTIVCERVSPVMFSSSRRANQLEKDVFANFRAERSRTRSHFA